MTSVRKTLPFGQVSSGWFGSALQLLTGPDLLCNDETKQLSRSTGLFKVQPCSRIDEVTFVVCNSHKTRDALQTVRLCLFRHLLYENCN